MSKQYQISTLSLEDITECCRHIRQLGENSANMEETAISITKFLDHVFLDDQGKSGLVLSRTFITIPYDQLTTPLQEKATPIFESQLISKEARSKVRCLSLIASYGRLAQWNDRHQSEGHKVIPFITEDFIKSIPMISRLISQLGLDAALVAGQEALILDKYQHLFGVFHIAEALDSPYIPAQKEFVIPHKVTSVIGMGGLLLNGEMFTQILFSKVPISAEQAEFFKVLALSIKVAFLPHGKNVFAENAIRQNKHELLQNELTAMKELLQTQEEIVLAQMETLKSEVQMRRKAQMNAEDALLSKSEFLNNMSHEIRTPLTTILSSTELLRECSTLSEAKDLNADMAVSGKHLLTLINDILDLSKIEAGKVELEYVPSSLQQLTDELSTMFSPLATKQRNRLFIHIDTNVPSVVNTDPTRLRQILINLLGNALKFTTNGEVSITIVAIKDSLFFEVLDTGIGMTEEQQQKIFLDFHQADNSTTRKYGGTGLGLTISKRLIEILGGKLIVNSTPQQGSKFSFKIPMPKIESSPVEEVATNTDSTQTLPELNILLVEDHEMNRKLMGKILKKMGQNVTDAENGQVAVNKALLSLESIPFDIILMDIQMPIMNGLDATRILRQGGWERPIFALTANVMDEDRHKCLDAGCLEVLRKPIQKKALIAALKKYSPQETRD